MEHSCRYIVEELNRKSFGEAVMRDRALSQSDESSAIVLIVEDDSDIVEAVSALTLPWSTS